MRKNGQTYYAPLVSVTDSSASNFRLVFGRETLALAATPKLLPEISEVYVDPPTISAYQGTTETATITAVANEAVQSLTYELTGASSWITNTNDIIYISPTDTDSGSAAVNVIAKDTGSTTQANTEFTAETKESPRITGITFTTIDLFGNINICYNPIGDRNENDRASR